MPMIRMTTRSSMSVKPFSSCMRARSLLSMLLEPSMGIVGPYGVDLPGPRSRLPEVAARQAPDPLEPRGFAPRPHERFAFDTSVTGYSRYRHTRRGALPLSNLIWGDDPTHDAAGARAVGSDGAGRDHRATRRRAARHAREPKPDAHTFAFAE